MPAKREKFVCRVCGSSDGYTRIVIPTRGAILPVIFFCNKCTCVFIDPKKFSNPIRKFSDKEIDELIKLGEDFNADVTGGKIPTAAPNY